jgi:hypothetical protein
MKSYKKTLFVTKLFRIAHEDQMARAHITERCFIKSFATFFNNTEMEKRIPAIPTFKTSQQKIRSCRNLHKDPSNRTLPGIKGSCHAQKITHLTLGLYLVLAPFSRFISQINQ